MDGINTAVRAGPPVNDLVTRAGSGDKQAWDTLVERYAPLIWSICRRHRLSSADAEDVGQRVWLQLVSSARSGGVSVAVTCSGNPVTLPEGVDLSAYRIVQEALSNAMRHAPGARVRVQVAYCPDSLALEIRNDAVASVLVPSGTRAAGGGHGLVGMRERATMLGGSLDAGPTEDGGFRVAAVLPVRHPEEET
jgi:signal transduction histidine kinase